MHEPCLYSGLVDGNRVLLLRQVDDFAVAAKSESIANHVFDLLDTHLTIPLKRLGLLTLFNSLDIEQLRYFIKISCKTYIEQICEKYLETWMRNHVISNQPTPLPQTDSFLKSFLSAAGDPSEQFQAKLSSDMGIKYRNAIGELIYALVTSRPDISYAVVKCAQATIHPHEIHYHAVKHLLKYIYTTRDDGIYYWRLQENSNLPFTPHPHPRSAMTDLLSAGRPQHDALDAHGYVDSDWATCPRTRQSLTGVCIRLAGGCIAYKTKL